MTKFHKSPWTTIARWEDIHLFSTLSAENEFSPLSAENVFSTSAENKFSILVCLISIPGRLLGTQSRVQYELMMKV